MDDRRKKIAIEEVEERERNRVIDELLRQWIECNTVCDLAMPKKKKDTRGLEKADDYMHILPGATYVLTQTLNYIFSNGLTTGSINEDEVLMEFLYRKNDRGNINLSELQNAIGMAITHGHSGLRWKDNNIYQYKWNEYRVITLKDDGVERVVGFLICKNGGTVPAFKFNYESYEEYDDFLREIREMNLILLDTDEFIRIRNNTSYVYGRSPLLDDEERLDLVVAVYEQLNYDIRYDGPGRILLRPKDGYLQGDETDISTSAALNPALESQVKQKKLIMAETERVAKDLKNSKSDAAIVLSNAFDKEIVHLGRVTKATEFFNWVKNDTMILAQDFGMSPSLLELGGVSGNVSMRSIIDTAMLNSIVPLRDKYASQISYFFAQHLGVNKVYFNLYEMAQQEDENTMRTKVVNMLSLLNAMRVQEGETEKIQPKAQQLFNDIADMLLENIHNENNQLEEL